VSLVPLAELELFNTKVKALVMSQAQADHEDTSEIIYDRHLSIITEGMEVPIDMTLNYSISKSCTPDVRIRYGSDGVWDEKIVIPQVRSIVRGVIGTASVYEMNEKRDIYSAKVNEILNIQFDKLFGKGCVFVSSSSIQNIYIPPQLQASIMAKQQMNEEVSRKILEIKFSEAEAKQRVAKEEGEAKAKIVNAQGIADSRIIEAKAIGESNRLITESLTKEVLAYKALENEKAQIDKWNGVRSKVVLGKESTPLIEIKEENKD